MHTIREHTCQFIEVEVCHYFVPYFDDLIRPSDLSVDWTIALPVNGSPPYLTAQSEVPDCIVGQLFGEPIWIDVGFERTVGVDYPVILPLDMERAGRAYWTRVDANEWLPIETFEEAILVHCMIYFPERVLELPPNYLPVPVLDKGEELCA